MVTVAPVLASARGQVPHQSLGREDEPTLAWRSPRRLYKMSDNKTSDHSTNFVMFHNLHKERSSRGGVKDTHIHTHDTRTHTHTHAHTHTHTHTHRSGSPYALWALQLHCTITYAVA